LSRAPLYRVFEWIRFRHWFARLYRVELRHAERVPASGPVILVANHESMLDPWLLGLVTPRPVRYMAKAELWENRMLGRVMDMFGTFPVDRGAGDRAAVGRGAALLEAGEVLGIFPQGTCLPYRHRPWFRGAAKLALAAGAPIVPVCIVGSEKALRPGKPKIGFPRITILVGEPIGVAAGRPTVAAARELTARIEQAIEDARRPFGPPEHAWFADERAA
jgi:1-acyl-sn-glycerol-3-phosphate acyltransferase